MPATLAGLLAALLFGAGAPLSKMLLPGTGPVLLAGLLYLGAGLGLLPVPARREAALSRPEWPVLAAAAIAGGAVGPVLMLWGLSHLSAVAGSLLLNLEAPLTILVALALFHEHLGRRELLGAALIVAGAAIVSSGEGFSATGPGAAAIAGACLCWALDNNLTAKLSLKDPAQIARIKSLAAGSINVAIGLASGDALPSGRSIALSLLLGLFSYGLSLWLFLLAQRQLGAARQAALFATAPFVGAVAAVPLLGERLGLRELGAGALMAAGVAALVWARHAHQHSHEAIEHEHLHVHDEHHQHDHDGPVDEPHSHRHRHEPLTHEHAHASDAHHRHQH